MVDNSNLIIVAYDNEKMIGITRVFTDFCFVAYMVDLAVSKDYQNQGIGKELVRKVQAELESECLLVLLSAPKSVDYYPKIGFNQHNSAWTLKASAEIK